MKDLLKNAWFNWIITSLFERIPGLKKVFAFVDGHKTTIGRVLMGIAALLAFAISPEGVCNYFSDWCASHPKFNEYTVKIIAGIGWLATELGLQHKTAKNMNEEGIVDDHEV